MIKFLEVMMRDDAGQGLVEYALILSLISIVAIVGLTAVRDNADNKLFTAANTLK